ncbi:hypothetical protein HWV62_8941 [Athelia sp. TMB]|nr:hypothetical protein HWV62_8941 [Athelia sp. TMB]
MVATSVAFSQEWALCIDDEVEIGMRKGFKLPIITYFLARVATLLYITTYTAVAVYTTLPSVYMSGGDPYLGGWFVTVNVAFVACWISSVLTSLLFFFRVLAVFKHSRTKKIVFSVLWGLTGCATFPLLSTVAIPNLPADVCQLYIEGSKAVANLNSCPERAWLAMILLIMIAAHNILVFISVSHQLFGNNTLVDARSIRNLITGNGLHPVSKSLLRSGQLYVSASIGLVLVTIAIYWGGKGWVVWSTIYPTAECILSCNVFRTLLLSEGRPGESSAVIRTEDVEVMVMAVMDGVNEASDPERSDPERS